MDYGPSAKKFKQSDETHTSKDKQCNGQ